MAEKATREAVASDLREPGFRAAISLIRTNLDKKKEKIASVNSEIGDMWAKVEGHRVNKVAAQFFAKLDKLEEADRVDIIRSFNGLAQNADWPDVAVDLVDTAQGKMTQMRLGADARNTGEDEDDDDEQGDDGDTPQSALGDALTRSRAHLRTVPDAMDAPKTH